MSANYSRCTSGFFCWTYCDPEPSGRVRQ